MPPASLAADPFHIVVAEPRSMGFAFRRINIIALAVMVLLCADPYLRFA